MSRTTWAPSPSSWVAKQARASSPFSLNECAREGRAHAGFVEARHGALEVADGGFGLGGVAAAELGLEQADVVFGVAEVGILALAHDLGEHLFGGLVVAGLDGELAQAAQTPDPVGRQGHRVGQHVACGFQLAGRLAGA